ncbi:MAG TPA: hypothetical protein VK524_12185 [Polyangiaceae bacterium]|nr:hypothetical protein [Polyangiaceae bacterium]
MHGFRLLAVLALLSVGCASDSRATHGERDAADAGIADARSDVTDAAGEETPDGPAGDELLSQTGLFEDMQSERLASGVAPYQPLYELWSDGAQKRRWLYLPPGTRIDTSDMDHWVYPVGTKLWKEFVRDGVRVETRLLHKRAADSSSWTMLAYRWNAEQSDAIAVPRGQSDASGTQHDIPSQTDCATCHDNMPDRVLGVSAIQLSHDLPGLTLQALSGQGRLTAAARAGGYPVPGGETERRALGYLHANCGNCHNPTSAVFSSVCLDLWLSTSALATVRETSIFASSYGVRVSSASAPSGVDCRLTGKSLANSSLYTRMGVRDSTQMPPLASERIDDAGRALVAAWIGTLTALGTCSGDCGAPVDAGGE